jgi:biofilm PGA synthesis N-glycosyltransferase PgaC
MNFNTVADYLLAFAYYYPLFMSYLWMCGGIYYRFHWECAGGDNYQEPPHLDHYPGVSV